MAGSDLYLLCLAGGLRIHGVFPCPPGILDSSCTMVTAADCACDQSPAAKPKELSRWTCSQSAAVGFACTNYRHVGRGGLHRLNQLVTSRQVSPDRIKR